MDNVSAGIVLSEVSEIYRAQRAGTDPELSPPVPFRAFADWQATRPETDMGPWRDILDRLDGPTRLAFATPRAPASEGTAEASRTLGTEASETLRIAAANLRVTLGCVVSTVWGLVVQRLSDSDEVLFGLAVTERPPDVPGSGSAVGNFVATRPVHLSATGAPTLRDLILETHLALTSEMNRGAVDLSALAALKGLKAGEALFDTVLSIEQPWDGPDHAPPFGDLEVRDRSEFPLSVFADLGEDIMLRVQYTRTSLSADDAETVLSAFGAALAAASTCLDQAPDDLPVIPTDAFECAALGDAGPPLSAPPEPVAQSIVRCIDGAPSATAIITREKSTSYAALADRAGQFHRGLVGAVAEPGARVAICLGAPEDAIAAMLAVWSAGCAYAPLGADEPPRRVADKLAVLAPAAVIADPATTPKLPPDIPVVAVDRAPAQGELNPRAAMEDPAYVIFTSGSTGTPKGVEITHGNLAASTQARFDWYGEAPDRFLLTSPLVFDSSVAGLYWTLAGGGTLILPDAETLHDPKALAALIKAKAVTHWLCLPSLYEVLLETAASDLQSLRTVIVAGEPVPPRLVALHEARMPGAKLFNEYGPTEATVWCAAARLDGGDGSAPIGRAIPGATLLIRDRKGRPVPQGLPGELYVGGPGVAKGYLRLPAETDARFVTDPARPGIRLYRTGDLVRRRPDGALDFLGRVDDQIKIRGHRVEPAEIEAALAALPGVQSAVVVARETAPKQDLVAFLVPDSETAPDLAALRSGLADALPDYMLPHHWEIVDSLPTTPTGKIDRRALAHRQLPDDPLPSQAPATPTELRLVDLWRDALRLEGRSVGVTDTLFELGGDSLGVMRLAGRLAETFELEISVAELLSSDLTIRGIGELIDRRIASVGEGARDETVRFPVPVSEGLKGLWLAARFHQGKPFFNLDAALRLAFVPTPAQLERTAQALSAKHGALRLGFELDDGALVLVERSLPPEIECREQPGIGRDGIEDWIQSVTSRPFDVSEDPLWRLALLTTGPREAILLLVIHHTISDGWSLDLLMRDLGRCLESGSLDTTGDVHAFARFVADQDTADDGAIAFWEDSLAGLTDTARLPTDRGLPRIADPAGHEARRLLSAPDETLLREHVARQGTTLLPLTWTALAALAWARSGVEDTLVAVSHANRGTSGLMEAVGCFTQPLPYRLGIQGDASFEAHCHRAQEFAGAARQHEWVPAARVVAGLVAPRQTYLTSFSQIALQINDFGGVGSRISGAEPYPHPARLTSFFELSVEWRSGVDGLECGILARADLFDPATVARILDDYLDLIRTALADPDLPMRDLFSGR